MIYKQFVKGAKPTPKHKKRVDISTESTNRKDKTKSIKRMKSPVKGEPTPEYVIQFHARERKGRMYMSDMMSVSPQKFAEVLTIWVLKSGPKLGFHPVILLKSMLQAGVEAWQETTGENLSPLLKLLKSVNIQQKG